MFMIALLYACIIIIEGGLVVIVTHFVKKKY